MGKLQAPASGRTKLPMHPRHASLLDFLGLPAERRGLDRGSWGFPRHTLCCSLKAQNDFLGLQTDQKGSFVTYTIVRNSIVWCSLLNYVRAMGLWHPFANLGSLSPTSWCYTVPVNSSITCLAVTGFILCNRYLIFVIVLLCNNCSSQPRSPGLRN